MEIRLVNVTFSVLSILIQNYQVAILMECYATAFEGEHEFLVFSTALLLLEESPLSLLLLGVVLFYSLKPNKLYLSV